MKRIHRLPSFKSEIDTNGLDSQEKSDARYLWRWYLSRLRAVLVGLFVGAIVHGCFGHSLDLSSLPDLENKRVPVTFTTFPQTKLLEAVGDCSSAAVSVVGSVERALQECAERCSEQESCQGFSLSLVTGCCELATNQQVPKLARRSWYVTGVVQDGDADAVFRSAQPFPRESTWREDHSATAFRVVASEDVPGAVRKDYRDVIRPLLLKLGMKEGRDWNFFWGLQWKTLDQFRTAKLEKHQQINMLPGAAKLVLGDKDALHRTVHGARAHLGPHIAPYIPASFLVPGDLQKLREAVHMSPSSVWISKRLNSWSGEGVTVLPGADVLAEASSATSPMVIQRYIDNPLTVRRHKFDVRWWAVVSSVSPLRVYMVNDGYLKIAKSKRYTNSPSGLKDRCVHVTNGKVQASCGSPHSASRRFPVSIRDPQTSKMLQTQDGALLGHKISAKQLYQTTRDAILGTIAMSLPALLEHQENVGSLGRHFQMLAFDVIYDSETGAPFVEEVNTNGYLGSGILKIPDGEHVLESMFELVGARGYSRSLYQRKVEDAIELFCGTRECSVDAVRAMQDYEDEFNHRGLWDAVFPPPRAGTRLSLEEYQRDIESKEYMQIFRGLVGDQAGTVDGLLMEWVATGRDALTGELLPKS